MPRPGKGKGTVGFITFFGLAEPFFPFLPSFLQRLAREMILMREDGVEDGKSLRNEILSVLMAVSLSCTRCFSSPSPFLLSLLAI